MSKILTSEHMLQTSRFAHPVGELDYGWLLGLMVRHALAF
jgi:hypothetical protein